MSDWNEFFGSLERFYTQVARLLRDADGMLDEHGLRSPKGKEKNVGMQGGAQLATPSFWFPGWLSRHYVEAGDEAIAVPRWYVAVLAYGRARDNDIKDLTCPVVTAGVWTFEKSEAWYYWLSKAWCWGDPRPVDGSVVERQLDTTRIVGTARCFAVELDTVRNDDDLRRLIVEPLIAIEAPRELAPEMK